MENKNETFHYSYSAGEQNEIESIRKKYLSESKDEDPMEKLRRLDRSVHNKANILSLVIGIVSALVMGSGMSLVLVGPSSLFILGIIVGVIGIGGAITAYPVYSLVLKKEKARVAPEILRLTDELLKK